MKATVENVEVDNRLVPLNQESIFQLSQFATSYALVFTPVRWLPNITIWVWEYTGVEPDALQTDLERIESKIDNLSA